MQIIIMNSIKILCILFIISQIAYCLPPPVTDPGCPVGAFRNGDRCYIYFNNVASNFTQAQYTCGISGGQLATVRNEADWRFVRALYIYTNYYRYWIAINDKSAEGQWTYGDSTPLFFAKWHDGEPNGNTEANCATVAPKFGYRWTDENCNSAFGYACQITNRASICSNNQIREGIFCYQAFEERVTATNAITKCAQINGFLADPKTENEYNAVLRSIYLNRSWQNLATRQITTFAAPAHTALNVAFIGIVRNRNLDFVNVDGTDAVFDWDIGEPNNFLGNPENCVNLQDSLKMNDLPCSPNFPLICQYSVN